MIPYILDCVAAEGKLILSFTWCWFKTPFKNFTVFLDAIIIINKADSHNLVNLGVPPQLYFITKTRVQVLANLLRISGKGSDTNAVSEVIYISIIVLPIFVDNVVFPL